MHFPWRKRPLYLSGSVSQTVVETEVDEKWTITEGFDSGSVITLQISDFPSFISTLFIAAAFLPENKMISLRQYNARNNRFGQTFAEAWWAWLTITEFHCGFGALCFPRVHLFICYSKWQWLCWGRRRGDVTVQQKMKSLCSLAEQSKVERFPYTSGHTHSGKHTPSCLRTLRWLQGSDLPLGEACCLCYNHRTSPANMINLDMWLYVYAIMCLCMRVCLGYQRRKAFL